MGGAVGRSCYYRTPVCHQLIREVLVSQGGSFVPLPASGGSRVPWLVATSPQSLPPSSHGCLPCLSSLLSLIRMLVEFTAHLDPPGWSHLKIHNQFHLQRPPFQTLSHHSFQWTYILGGTLLCPP